MIDIVKRFFSKASAEVNGASNQNTKHDIRVATCALFVEIASIDEKFTEAEMKRIEEVKKLPAEYGMRLTSKVYCDNYSSAEVLRNFHVQEFL